MEEAARVPGSIETSLLRVVVGYRIIGAIWLGVLGGIVLATSDELERPETVVLTIVLAALWTAGVVLASVRRPEALRSWAFVGADAVVATLTILAGSAAGSGSFAGGYPVASVFHGVYAAGWAGGLVTSGALTLLAVWQVSSDEAADLSSASGAVLVYVFTAAAAAWAVATIRQRDAMREAAERALVAERTERARAEERAELATRIHDGVLQTLALIQRDVDDGGRVAGLARRQERELREVLYGGAGTAPDGFKAALTSVCREVEDLSGLQVDVVVVGDQPPGPAVAATTQAAREALVNAAKHAEVEEVDVYGEADEDRLVIFVRDRGRGFEPEAVAPDRRGIAESMRGRMAIIGGTVNIRSAPGAGTEVKIESGGVRD